VSKPSDANPPASRYCRRCRSIQPVGPDVVDGVKELRCLTCGKAHVRGRVDTKISGQAAVVRRGRE